MPEFFIPGNVPSSKNSKVATSKGVFPSKTVQKYLRSLGIKSYSPKTGVKHYARRLPVLKYILDKALLHWLPQYPIVIGFHFVRGTKHKFDFINAIQILQDLLVAYKVIEDDDADHLVPYILDREGKYYSYDKENPGVWIRID